MGIAILIGLLTTGLILILWSEQIEHQKEMEKFNESKKKIKTRIDHLLEVENKYDLITRKWWFKLFFRESHILGENKK